LTIYVCYNKDFVYISYDMIKQSKGQLESDISNAVTQFEKNHLGRGPKETHTFIIQDMILIRLKGVLTPAEKNLAKNIDGARLIKQVRLSLVENSRYLLEQIIFEKTDAKLLSLHTDISSHTGERIFILILDRDLEMELNKR